jgi:hypothetical protein
MALEILEIFIVVEGVISDCVVFFCRSVHDGGIFVRKARQVYTILFRMQNLGLSKNGQLI